MTWIQSLATPGLTPRQPPSILRSEMQLSFKKVRTAAAVSLVDLAKGEEGVLDRLDLPEDEGRRLMELGFLPGSSVVAAMSAPGGDPRVFRVDGSEVALRRDTSSRILLRIESAVS